MRRHCFLDSNCLGLPVRRIIFLLSSKLLSAGLRSLATAWHRDALASLEVALRQLKEISFDVDDAEELKMVLLAAEDHRYFYHSGADPVAIVRATVRTLQGDSQGGSTIEQQLVRTIRKDHQRTLRRKFRELLLASHVAAILSKEEILIAYLSIAYFGEGLIGYMSASEVIANDGHFSDTPYLISHLKYPRPLKSQDNFRVKRDGRSSHIRARVHSNVVWEI